MTLPVFAARFSLVVAIFIGTSSLPHLVQAQSGGLAAPQDLINTMMPEATSEHSVSFTLPLDAAPIRTGDYIQIFFPHFTNVTAPTMVGGSIGGGVPNFSVNGKYARVTNITVAPGKTISVDGITTTNPLEGGQYQVVILITEDAAGLIVKNIASVFSTQNPGTVSVSASIDSPEARLMISGDTAPETFVTFTEYTSVSGTAISALNGYFSKIFSGILPADHTITFFGIDKYNLTTSPVTITVYTPAFQQTDVTNQLLSPTLRIAQSAYQLGHPIVASGTAYPNSTVTLFSESPLRSYTTTTDNVGDWAYTISDTATFLLGDYQLYALVQKGGGLTSLHSPSLGFSIISSATPSGTACGDISRGDLDCSDLIDLTDFSIMMYYWGTNNGSADINNDSIVNLTDFSILMYWWGT
jgi:hypothetical protein